MMQARGKVEATSDMKDLVLPPNATVDASGRLHLAITRQGKTWSCAEVVLDQWLGYGTYEWTLGSDGVFKSRDEDGL